SATHKESGRRARQAPALTPFNTPRSLAGRELGACQRYGHELSAGATECRSALEPFVAAIAQKSHRHAHNAISNPDRGLVEPRPKPPVDRCDLPRTCEDHFVELALELLVKDVVAHEDIRFARHQQAVGIDVG